MDFERVLDDCLARLTAGGSTLDECLALYPGEAEQLGPLLRTAMRFEIAQQVKPAPAFRARARESLMKSMRVHPRRRPWAAAVPVWRLAASLAVLVLVLAVTGTAFAQGALPGQALYAWKLSSESIWRAVAPDPVVVDLTLADRRVAEMTAMAGNPAQEAQAQNGYQEVLARLSAESDAQNGVLILQTLQSHQAKLSAAGISIPALDHYLSPSAPETAPARPAGTPAPTLSNPAPTDLPKIIPTVQIPGLLP